MAHLSLSLLGAFQVSWDGDAITTFESDKVRALLAYLAVEATQPHRRDRLVGLFWPESTEAAARRNLSQALFNLRQAIGDQTASPPYLHISREAIQFNTTSDHALDVARITALLDACDAHQHQRIEKCAPCVQRLQQATRLYHGPFLEDLVLADSAAFEEWTLVHRETLHRRALEALAHLAEYYERRGDVEAARQYATRQLELDPWREEAHRQVMRLLALSGERSAALAQYEACRRTLTAELGVEPSAETTLLYRQIQRGEVKAEPAALEVTRLTNLPTSLTPFIGRVLEVTQLAGLLADPDCRLITLVGSGGIGKTRLALQVAAEHHEAFMDGVAFVPLAPVGAATLIASAIADALGFTFSGTADPQVQVLDYLRAKQILLVLDNMEHLLGDVGLVADILQHAPEVKLLVTSREPLQLHGEWVFAVQGLPTPPSDQADEFENYAAVSLFLQRARQADLGWTIAPGDRAAIARICGLVAGMPFGIELAAAWIRTLSCDEIAREIERNLDFLAVSLRDVPERHRSLRAVFDHSWKLLAAAEQQVMRSLSVFRGGFTREAAEQVAGASLSGLSALLAKSLLRRNHVGRYDLHELTHQYATGHLADDLHEEATTRHRHCSYYATLLMQWERPLKGGQQQAAVAVISREIDNVRLAWHWAITNRNVPDLRQLLQTLSWFYELRGWLQEGVLMFSEAAAMLQNASATQADASVEDQIALGQVLTWQGYFLQRRGQLAQAREILEHSLALLGKHGDQAALADALLCLGIVIYQFGEYPDSRHLLQESLTLSTTLDDRWRVAVSLTLLGMVAHAQGEYQEALALFREGLTVWRAVGSPGGLAFCLNFYSTTLLVLAEYREAQTALRESLALSSVTADRSGLAQAFNHLGVVAQALGEYQEAQYLFHESLALFKDIGNLWGVARALNHLGGVSWMLDINPASQQYFHEALVTAMEAKAVPVALDVIGGIAAVRAKEGAAEATLELAACILQHPASSKETQDCARQLRAEVELQLLPEQVEAAQARGRAKPLETLVVETLAGLTTVWHHE